MCNPNEKIEKLETELKAYKGMLHTAQQAQKALRILLWNTVRSCNKDFSPKKHLEDMTSTEIKSAITIGLARRDHNFDKGKREESLRYARQILEPYVKMDATQWPRGLSQLINILS